MSVFPGTGGTGTVNGSQQEQEDGQADELCNLFSVTLRSMAADALAVRQLSSLAMLNDMTRKTTRVDGENYHPNIHREEDKSMKDLKKLDDIVTAIEQKVGALREIVSEEKKALKKFESTLKQEAQDQAAAIIQMVNACQALENSKQSERNHDSPMRSTHHGTPSGRRDSFDPRNAPPTIHGQSRHNNQNENVPIPVKFRRVTNRELKGFSRNTLGRVSLLDLNEALTEIEQVCDRKNATLQSIPHHMANGHTKKSSSLSSSSSSSSTSLSSVGPMTNSLQRRYDYLKQQRANVELEVEAHAGHVWISEQELRENCAFFRNGESTARAILSILCSLKRLKQIPGRNMEITYICRTDDNDDDDDVDDHPHHPRFLNMPSTNLARVEW